MSIGLAWLRRFERDFEDRSSPEADYEDRQKMTRYP